MSYLSERQDPTMTLGVVIHIWITTGKPRPQKQKMTYHEEREKVNDMTGKVGMCLLSQNKGDRRISPYSLFLVSVMLKIWNLVINRLFVCLFVFQIAFSRHKD